MSTSPDLRSPSAFRSTSSESPFQPFHHEQTKNVSKKDTNVDSRCTTIIKQQLCYHFIYWLYCDVIHSLISANFYVTEVEGGGRAGQVHYFRKPIWAHFANKGRAQLQQNFIPVKKTIISFLRFWYLFYDHLY